MLNNTIILLVIAVLTKATDVVLRLLISYSFGVDSIADVYWSLITLPDYFLALSGVITLNGVMNTKFAEYVNSQASKVFPVYLTIVLIISVYTLFIVLVMILFSYDVISLLFPGFDYQKKIVSASYFRILVPVMILKGINIINTTLLFAYKFYKTAVSMNLVTVTLMLIFYFFSYTNESIVINMIYAIIISNFIILFICLYIFYRMKSPGFSVWCLDFKEIKSLLYASFLTYFAVLANQAYIFSRNIYASELYDGALSVLYYSSSISALLINLFYMAFFNFYLTTVAGEFKKNNAESIGKILHYMIGLISIFTPLVIFIIVARTEFLQLLYLRGNFRHEDLELCYSPFTWEMLSVLGNLYFLLFNAILLAAKEYLYLNLCVVISYMISIVSAFLLYDSYQVTGISLSAFIGSAALFISLLFVTGKSLKLRIHHYLNIHLPVMIGFITFAVIYVTYKFVPEITKMSQVTNLTVFLVLSYLIYFLVFFIFKRSMFSEIYRNLKQKLTLNILG